MQQQMMMQQFQSMQAGQGVPIANAGAFVPGMPIMHVLKTPRDPMQRLSGRALGNESPENMNGRVIMEGMGNVSAFAEYFNTNGGIVGGSAQSQSRGNNSNYYAPSPPPDSMMAMMGLGGRQQQNM